MSEPIKKKSLPRLNVQISISGEDYQRLSEEYAKDNQHGTFSAFIRGKMIEAGILKK